MMNQALNRRSRARTLFCGLAGILGSAGALAGCGDQLVLGTDPGYVFERVDGMVPLFGTECAEPGDDTFLLVYQRNLERSGLTARDDLSLIERSGGRLQTSFFPELPIVAATVPASALPELRKSPNLAFVGRNCRYKTQTASETLMPWNLDRIDQAQPVLDQVYQMPATGSGVNVYVLDSGVNISHEQFGGRASHLHTAIADGRGASDCTGHGTLVASVIGGIDYGVAKESNLLSVRIADCTNTTTDLALTDGIRQAIKHHNAQQDIGKIQRGVINLSFANKGMVAMAMAHVAVDEAVRAGLVVVGAAGNYGGDACSHFPGGIPMGMGSVKDNNVLLAGLVDSADSAVTTAIVDGRPMKFDEGSCIDVYAPGLGIPGAAHSSSSDLVQGSGTSLSAAHVTGVVALYLERFPRDTVQQTRDKVIQRSTRGRVQGTVGVADPRLLFNDNSGVPRAIQLALPYASRPVSAQREILKNTSFAVRAIPTGARVVLSSDLKSSGSVAVDDNFTLSCKGMTPMGAPTGSPRSYSRTRRCPGSAVPYPPDSLASVMAVNQDLRCDLTLQDYCGAYVGTTRLFLNILK